MNKYVDRNLLSMILAVHGLLCISGCTVDVRDGLGPRVPVPNVEGVVLRGEEEAEGLRVELRDGQTAAEVDATVTDDDGEFLFADVGGGLWEIKVHGDEFGDFDSISHEFATNDVHERVQLPPLDIFAYGAELLEPPDSATVDAPSPDGPITFRWAPAGRSMQSARVQVYDEDGETVWHSPKMMADEWEWDGFGNMGNYDGKFVAPGSYRWRIKIELQDSVEARLDKRTMVIKS